MRKICDGCIHKPACESWIRGVQKLTGLKENNEEKPCKYFKPLPSRRALPMPKLTRLGWNGMCYVEMKNGIVYSRKEVDAWLRRYMSKEARA